MAEETFKLICTQDGYDIYETHNWDGMPALEIVPEGSPYDTITVLPNDQHEKVTIPRLALIALLKYINRIADKHRG